MHTAASHGFICRVLSASVASAFSTLWWGMAAAVFGRVDIGFVECDLAISMV